MESCTKNVVSFTNYSLGVKGVNHGYDLMVPLATPPLKIWHTKFNKLASATVSLAKCK